MEELSSSECATRLRVNSLKRNFRGELVEEMKLLLAESAGLGQIQLCRCRCVHLTVGACNRESLS